MMKKLITICVLIGLQSSYAAQTYLTDVPGYGYNTVAYKVGDAYVGCGPTSGTMILDTYDNRLATPGSLVSDPLTTAWDLHYNYMNTNAGGYGNTTDFHYGMQDYASDHGYVLDAVIHVEPTTYNPADWTYAVPDDLVADATFWNTTTWNINVDDFIDFIAPEIAAGDPLMFSVDTDGSGEGLADHWMVCVGYDDTAGQWGGYNTWDTTLHWYDVESSHIAGNTMGIAFVRTFEFVPEPATLLLLSLGSLAVLRKRRA